MTLRMRVVLLLAVVGAGWWGVDQWRLAQLPAHEYLAERMPPRESRRVLVQVQHAWAVNDPLACRELVRRYRNRAEPDGQVVVQAPTDTLPPRQAPWCVDNMDGAGVQFPAR